MLFSPIAGMMIQSDELIFFRGVETTNQIEILKEHAQWISWTNICDLKMGDERSFVQTCRGLLRGLSKACQAVSLPLGLGFTQFHPQEHWICFIYNCIIMAIRARKCGICFICSWSFDWYVPLSESEQRSMMIV